jgi:RHS repeat-associated protein
MASTTTRQQRAESATNDRFNPGVDGCRHVRPPPPPWCAVLAAILALACSVTVAQVTPQEQFAKIVNGGEAVGRLDGGAFGDQINLSTGAVDFATTDVAIPGNSAIPVSFGRRRTIEIGAAREFYLGDWDIDVPFLEGTYVARQGWVVQGPSTQADHTLRCANATSVAAAEPGEVTESTLQFLSKDYWSGNHLHMPGAGAQELLVNDRGVAQPPKGGPYRFVTSAHWFFECMPLAESGAGDAFRARSPNGLTYSFNQMVVSSAPALLWPRSNGGTFSLARERVRLYVTRIEDRFGNWVSYQWNGARLNAIAANDGRNITIVYDDSTRSGQRIREVTAHSTDAASATPPRTWRYDYSPSGDLTSVTQPDGTAWGLDFSSINLGLITYVDSGPGQWDQSLYCNWMRGLPTGTVNHKKAILTHPSGARATFSFKPVRHGRTWVDVDLLGTESCRNPIASTSGGGAHSLPSRAARFDVWSILEKRIEGPGLPGSASAAPGQSTPDTWTYDYSNLPVGNFCRDANNDGQPDVGLGCPSGAFANEKQVRVRGPDGTSKLYSFGIRYGGNDSQLLSTATSSALGTLHAKIFDYVATPATYGMPARIGSTPQLYGDSHFGEVPRPERLQRTTQQGVVFTREVSSFDYWGHPTFVTKSSSLGAKAVTLAYRAPDENWVIGLLRSMSTAPSNISKSPDIEINYNDRALPSIVREFGLITQTAQYHADGNLHYLFDGNDHWTRFSGYRRGLATSVEYQNGEAQSATINDFGQITEFRDELNLPTRYDYRPDGRLERIVYPSDSTLAANDKVFDYQRLPADDIGLSTDLWQQTITQGSALKRVYLDALWRPILSKEEDTAVGGTQRYTRRSFDFAGRETFVSAPSRTLPNGQLYQLTTGVQHQYDGLGRLISAQQSAEAPHGALTTLIQYEPGFTKKVIPPSGKSTLTSFLAFDEPIEDWPVLIEAPETMRIAIARDAYGKPLTITRSGTQMSDGAALAVSAQRKYIYDDNEQLCKTVDPELGATIYEFDNAGNLRFVGEGLNLPGPACDREQQAYRAVRTEHTYDYRNRKLNSVYADTSPSIQRTYYPDGALHTLLSVDPTTGASVQWSYVYDSRRLLTSETLALNGRTFNLSSSYTANGHLRSIGYPDSREISYAPNALGEPTQAGDATTLFATAVATHPDGTIRSFKYGNGIVHSTEQNIRQLPARRTDSGGVFDETYTYDRQGNLASIADSVASASRSMQYDDLDRLETVSAAGPWPSARYAYDALDNIRASTVGVRAYQHQYNAQNQLQSLNIGATPALAYSHVRGNVTQRGSQGFTFDRANRLLSTWGPSPASEEAYAYDGHGRRVNITKPRSGAKRFMVYSASGQLRFESDEATGKFTNYIYLGKTLIAKDEATLVQVPQHPPVVTAPATNSSGSYAVSWTMPAGAATVEVIERKDAGDWMLIHAGTGLSRAVSLRGNGTYLYKAKACNAAGCSAYGDAVATQVSGVSSPPPPAGLVASPNPSHTGDFEVRWPTSGAATGYRLDSKPANASIWTTDYQGAQTSFDASVKTVGEYHYRVMACAAGCSVPTPAITVTVLENLGVLSPPVLSVPTTSTTGNYSVTWADVAGRTSYELQERKPNAWSWVTRYSNGIAQSQTFTNTNGAHWYRVRTCNAAGCGNFGPARSVDVSIPAPVPVPSPFTVNPDVSTNGSASIQWGAVPGANVEYRLQRRPDPGSDSDWTTIYTGPSTSRNDSGLANGRYAYQVRACVTTCGEYASAIILTVDIPPLPPTVVASMWADPTTTTTGNFNVLWTPVAGATHYYLEERVDGGNVELYSVTSSSNPVRREFNQRGSGRYTYTIRACKHDALPLCGDYGTAVAAVVVSSPTTLPAPATITGPQGACVAVAGGQDHTFTISWSTVPGAAVYEVIEEDDITGNTYPVIQKTPSTNPNVQFQQLTRGRRMQELITYSYRVRACATAAGNCATAATRGTAYQCLRSPQADPPPPYPPEWPEPNPPRPQPQPWEDVTSSITYLHADALGSPVVETSSSGAVVSRRYFEPYGAPTDGNYVDGPGFTGHVEDAATGLTYMQQRYYDPMAGRFMSLDPVTADTTTAWNFNRYNYANNSPYKFTDPDGRDPDVAYGAAVGLMMGNDPEKMRIWAGGEAAATTEGSGAENGAAMGMIVGEWMRNGDYSMEAVAGVAVKAMVMAVTKGKIKDFRPGAKFTPAQKRDILAANRDRNGGELKSDKSGDALVPSEKSKSGVTPSPLEAQVDHKVPRSAGGTNDPANAQVLSRKENRDKSDTVE